MSSWIVQRKWVGIAILTVLLLFGAFLRLHHVDHHTISHPEVYTPGIDLPWELSNPHPRFSLWQTLAGTIAGEPHPPGYYILMLGWTRWFGSDILTLRLPSVLFGIASILLVYILSILAEDKLTAVLATGMLAFNGLHIYWSQQSRMYSMGCFLGLVSTVLLVLISKNFVQRRIYYAVYAFCILTGLATHVFFWALFGTQTLWILMRS